MKALHYPRSRMFAALLLLFSTIYFSVNTTAKCYKPNGDLALNDQPCFPQNPVSSCCGGSTYVCSTNNMCARYSGEHFVIGSCTDKTWNSPACPGYYFFHHVHNSVFRCSADTDYCADRPSYNYTTGHQHPGHRRLSSQYSDLVGSAVTLNTAVATSSLFTPIGASLKKITTVPVSTAELIHDPLCNYVVVLGLGNPCANFLRCSRCSDAFRINVRPQPRHYQIGLGVGLSLGGVAVILLVLPWFMWRRSKRNKHPIEVSQTQYPYQTRLPAPPLPPPQAPVEAPVYHKHYSRYPCVNSAEPPVYEAPGHGI
ncbi:uncharacterized protein KD926_006908 [Aspergillus affinis]|uniref:uncharacterized protein n=1 Tax=Aspergillus affinis TaxID=1070780 RepID=UPI0022FDD58A|nr:uncharacterized protein KD926_006908 [Aspergillus affinis]KAI9041332.1 hypothetical protein KD926_006908 [Aspergillus affinis]